MIEEILILHRSANVLISCRENFARPSSQNRAMSRNPMPIEHDEAVESPQDYWNQKPSAGTR